MSLKKRKFYTSNVQVHERAWDEKTEDYTGMKLFDIYFANEVDSTIEELKKWILKNKEFDYRQSKHLLHKIEELFK